MQIPDYQSIKHITWLVLEVLNLTYYYDTPVNILL